MDVVARNNVTVLGRGSRPMLFAHGFGCDQNMWRYVVPSFTEDHRVVLFDYVGHGGSDASHYDRQRYSSLHGYARDVLDICDALDLRGIDYVGHSVSAMIGMLAAIEQPERFRSLVLIGPSPAYINDGDYVAGFERNDIEQLLDMLDSNYFAWAKTMAPKIMGNDEKPELGGELTDSFCRTDAAIAKDFARVTFLSDNRQDLGRLRCPSLILQCARDAIAPASVGEYVHRALPQSKLVKMQATGHCPNLSAPAETVAAIKQFLRERDAEPAVA